MVPPPIALHLALKDWARNMMPVCGDEPRRRLRRSASGPELNSLSMCTHACTQLHSLKLFDARGIGVRGQELPQFQRASVVQKQVLAGKTCTRLNTTAKFWASPQVLRPNRAVEVPRHQRQSFATKCINTPETTMPATCNIPSHSPAKISTKFECSSACSP